MPITPEEFIARAQAGEATEVREYQRELLVNTWSMADPAVVCSIISTDNDAHTYIAVKCADGCPDKVVAVTRSAGAKQDLEVHAGPHESKALATVCTQLLASNTRMVNAQASAWEALARGAFSQLEKAHTEIEELRRHAGANKEHELEMLRVAQKGEMMEKVMTAVPMAAGQLIEGVKEIVKESRSAKKGASNRKRAK